MGLRDYGIGTKVVEPKILPVPVLDEPTPAQQGEIAGRRKSEGEARESTPTTTETSVSALQKSRGGQKCPVCERRKKKEAERKKRWREKHK